MFDWVLNTPLNTITIFISWRFQIKVNEFFNFFSTINFPYQYLLEPHFNKVTGLYPAILLKERTPTQVFSGQFCKTLKTPFLQNTSRWLLLFYEKKYFTNKIVKNPLRKGKKQKQLVRKTTKQAKEKPNYYLHQVFKSFYYSKMSLFLFSLLLLIY